MYELLELAGVELAPEKESGSRSTIEEGMIGIQAPRVGRCQGTLSSRRSRRAPDDGPSTVYVERDAMRTHRVAAANGLGLRGAQNRKVRHWMLRVALPPDPASWRSHEQAHLNRRGGALALAAPLQAQSDPAALVIRVEGDVDVTHGGEPPAPASIGEQMYVGDGVIPDDGSRAVLITRAGQPSRSLPSRRRSPSPASGRETPTSSIAPSPPWRRPRTRTRPPVGRQGMIRPIPGQTALVVARATTSPCPVPDPRSAGPRRQEQSYDLMLRSLDGGRPMLFEVGNDTTWALPDSLPDLELGASYQWTVFVGRPPWSGRAMQPQTFKRHRPGAGSVELTDYLDQIAVFGLDPTDGRPLPYRGRVPGHGPFLRRPCRLSTRWSASASISAGSCTASKGEVLAELGHESRGESRVRPSRRVDAMTQEGAGVTSFGAGAQGGSGRS